jgi:hypothetical protein
MPDKLSMARLTEEQQVLGSPQEITALQTARMPQALPKFGSIP